MVFGGLKTLKQNNGVVVILDATIGDWIRVVCIPNALAFTIRTTDIPASVAGVGKNAITQWPL